MRLRFFAKLIGICCCEGGVTIVLHKAGEGVCSEECAYFVRPCCKSARSQSLLDMSPRGQRRGYNYWYSECESLPCCAFSVKVLLSSSFWWRVCTRQRLHSLRNEKFRLLQRIHIQSPARVALPCNLLHVFCVFKPAPANTLLPTRSIPLLLLASCESVRAVALTNNPNFSRCYSTYSSYSIRLRSCRAAVSSGE